ncbi:MAG TPA: hypothetical protein VHW66_04505 [Stellaceae bacterium]|nr:hypothetical protein [Stellaceae bacterium]
MYRTYERRAKQAVSPTVRTVNMLGMMCAAAVAQGGFFAFVGKGYGGDWPNPCEPDDATQTTQDGAARPQTRTEEA